MWTFCGMGQICCSHEALHQPTSHFWKRRNNARCKPRGFDTIRTMFGVVTHDPFALGGLYIALPRSFSWSLLEVGTSTRTLRRWSLGVVPRQRAMAQFLQSPAESHRPLGSVLFPAAQNVTTANPESCLRQILAFTISQQASFCR